MRSVIRDIKCVFKTTAIVAGLLAAMTFIAVENAAGADTAIGTKTVAAEVSSSFDRPDFNRPDFDRPFFNRPFFDRPDFDRPFFVRPAFNPFFVRPAFSPFFVRPAFNPFFNPFFDVDVDEFGPFERDD